MHRVVVQPGVVTVAARHLICGQCTVQTVANLPRCEQPPPCCCQLAVYAALYLCATSWCGLQLMMVMPSASKALLPQPFHSLMDDPKSPIADFYPIDFAVDGEGKRTDWEVVILLPFIDFKRLEEAYDSRAAMLSPEAHRRNSTGNMYLFKYHKGSTETSFCQSTLPTMLPSVTASNSTVDELPPKKPLPPGAPGFQPALTKVSYIWSKLLDCLASRDGRCDHSSSLRQVKKHDPCCRICPSAMNTTPV